MAGMRIRRKCFARAPSPPRAGAGGELWARRTDRGGKCANWDASVRQPVCRRNEILIARERGRRIRPPSIPREGGGSPDPLRLPMSAKVPGLGSLWGRGGEAA